MTTSCSQIREGSIIVGSLFNELMRVETVRVGGDGTWTVGLVGTQSERFRKVTLTATPHKGDPKNFSLFLQLLDKDAYADVKSIHEAMDRRRAPFYLRRTKEAMVYFPERRPDGTWVAEKIFTKRIPHTVDFQIDGAEFDLYRDITRFVKRQSAKAAAQGDDPRARAVGFLMSLYQRRLASSTHAMRRSLENRVRRLEEGLKHAQELARLAPPDLPDPEELEEMEEDERGYPKGCGRSRRSLGPGREPSCRTSGPAREAQAGA